MIKSKLVNHSIRSLTKRITELSKYTHDKNETKETIKKEMGNFYNSSRLCFTIEESIDLIFMKLEEDWEKYGKPSWYDSD